MKTGILAVIVVCLLGLSGWLFYDNSRLQKALNQALQQRSAQDADAGKASSQASTELAATTALLADAKNEIARLKNELAFPVRINSRKAATGNAYSVEIFNQTKQFVSVAVSFTNATRKAAKTFNFDLGPGFSRDVGKMDGWSAASGDVLQVECPQFLPIERKLD